jgi:hypothetical protein
MANREHELSNRKGSPVTMLRDQSEEAKKTGVTLVFLKPHPDYPNYKSLSDMKGRPPKPLVDCNGFCGTYDLESDHSALGQLNFDDSTIIFRSKE